MKTVFKWIGAVFGLAVTLLTILAVNVIWFKPFHISIFYDKAFLLFALDDPEMLTHMGMEPFGMDGYNAEFKDESPAQTRMTSQLLVDNLETLRSYNREKLEGQAALSYDIMEWFMDQQVRGLEFMWHGYPVNQLFGIQNTLPSFMTDSHQIDDVEDAEYYVARLSKWHTKFSQVLEDLNERNEKGIYPPRFVIDQVIDSMKAFRDTPANENVLYTDFVERIGKLENISETTRTALSTQALSEIETSVYPGYNLLIEFFEGLSNTVTSDHGVWMLPDGDKYYAQQLRGHTTTDLTADEIHRLGLSEVARIETEMHSILIAEGYAAGTVGERMRQLNSEERFLFPNTEEGREQILAEFRKIIAEIDAGVDDMFSIRPRSELEVKPVPEHQQEGGAGAWYQAPDMGGSRPGRFYVNLRDLKEHPRYTMRTLSYHEAVPGHHFQSALQVELTGVARFRQMLGFTAFSEGWALYSERLAWESGFQNDPFDNLGRLQHEMLRAVRLVADTGIHAQKWPREDAIAYMFDKTGLTKTEVVTEIDRYFVMPGQATSYKIGMLKILELRERAKTELGDKFDLRDFHKAVLQNGDVPLDILEEQIDKYIAESI